MSVTAIGPVPFVNATSVNLQEPRAQNRPQDDAQTPAAQAPAVTSSSSVVAAQAFTGFSPDVQPIASLIPAAEMPQPLPVDLADSSTASVEWSGSLVDVYA